MFEDYIDDEIGAQTAAAENPELKPTTNEQETQPESDRRLVEKIIKEIKADKQHHKKAFERMKRDQFIAFHGREPGWHEKNYKANFVGRHVKQKTAALFAKNPRAIASRVERLDFQIWDENPETLLQAKMIVEQGEKMLAEMAQAAQQAAQVAAADPAAASQIAAAVPMAPEPAPTEAPVMAPPEPLPGYNDARALIEDFVAGMQFRQTLAKLGKTLELLFAKAMRDQNPIDFKTGLKQVVRRAITTSVGYVELNFQRENGPAPLVEQQLADARTRLAHIQRLAKDLEQGELDKLDAEAAELEKSIASLQEEPEIVLREGLIFDYPRSTKVIPDRLTKSLIGFIGARRVTIEYEYTHEKVRELFDIDLERYRGYSSEGTRGKTVAQIAGELFDEDGNSIKNDKSGLVRVWKCYDKDAGLVYYVADGYHDFLRKPAAPDVFVEEFWPLFPLTFNEVENEDELFPPSDVQLLEDMQSEHNRSRQGKREHREAARPRWGYSRAALSDEDDIAKIGKVKPFEAIPLNIDPSTQLDKILQAFPVPGVDPNLYDTNEVFADAQLSVGAQEAQLGGLSKATATESAIAANSSATSDTAAVDDLDTYLTQIARAGSQILLREMSEPIVKQKIGPGAFWPELSLADIASEVYLEVEAGSSGRPNKAAEVSNWKQMLPFLIQMQGIKQTWLARETLKRLDDKMDLTEAISEGAMSTIAMNKMAQAAPADPMADPNSQGAEGADQTSKPADTGAGSDPAFGSNQV